MPELYPEYDFMDDPEAKEWCPMACGGITEDPYGGPCANCLRSFPDLLDGLPGNDEEWHEIISQPYG